MQALLAGDLCLDELNELTTKVDKTMVNLWFFAGGVLCLRYCCKVSAKNGLN